MSNRTEGTASVKSFLRRLFKQKDEASNCYLHEIQGDGVLFASRRDLGNPANEPELVLYQHALLQQLVEQGDAELVPGGFFMPTETVLMLTDDDIDLLELPQRLKAELKVQFRGTSVQVGFMARGVLAMPNGDDVPAPKPYGPVVEIDGEDYVLNSGQHTALLALATHAGLKPNEKSEEKNLELIALLQEGAKTGAEVQLRHFDSLDVIRPDKPSIALTRREDGSLDLTPVFGAEINPDDIDRRLGQIVTAEEGQSSLRVRNKIVFLTEERLEATKQIIEKKHIPANQVADFLATPSAFLNPDLIDLDTGFAVRVQGVTEFRRVPNSEWKESEHDWFHEVAKACSPAVLNLIIHTEDDAREFEKATESAWSVGASEVVFGDEVIKIADKDLVRKSIASIRENIQQRPPQPDQRETTGEESKKQATYVLGDVTTDHQRLLDLASKAASSPPPDFSPYKRQPFPHQESGVRWMLGLSMATTTNDAPSRICGGLLADDMGLGKTYMALVGVDQFLRSRREAGEVEKPVLVVAPLSLLENWRREVTETFHHSPFDDIVVLQAAQDLSRFRLEGASRETQQQLSGDEGANLEGIQFSLKVGSQYGKQKLDQPRRLVLASYETLRNFQFSLGRVDWSWVIFDEAQNIKNPNTLQTRAAIALKAQFKLLATGTPVENRLADFWCIMDIAQPGLLGSWEHFREEYVKPAEEDAAEAGRRLHRDVGAFMLRRTKEGTLEGIPAKHIHHGAQTSAEAPSSKFDPLLRAPMSPAQIDLYDETLSDLRVRKRAGNLGSAALQALHRLRQISLHPDLAVETQQRVSDFDQWAKRGCKVTAIGKLLDKIKAQNEKVLIFVIYKSVQRDLKVWLERRYGIDVGIINGETKATGQDRSSTRLGIIDKFQASVGFNILVMSPIAAGVGLTITEANHVIHFERHWNPAKESQATDRVYRIGQKRDVHVYLPLAAHPSVRSFDDTLDELLRSKVQLKDAVVAPQPVTEKDVLSAI